MQLTVGYNGEVARREVKKTKQIFEEKLRAEALALQAAQQFRVVPEDWMERSAENQFGSTSFVIDSDDEGGDDDKGVAAEIHTINSLTNGGYAVNHDGLTDASFGEYAGIAGFADIDFAAIDDKITTQEESDEVTQEQQNGWHASKLAPT